MITLAVVGLLPSISCSRLAAQSAFTDDFSMGINSANWAVRTHQPLYSVDTSAGNVRVSKPATNNTTFQFIGPGFLFAAQGNFDTRVDCKRCDVSTGSEVLI